MHRGDAGARGHDPPAPLPPPPTTAPATGPHATTAGPRVAPVFRASSAYEKKDAQGSNNEAIMSRPTAPKTKAKAKPMPKSRPAAGAKPASRPAPPPAPAGRKATPRKKPAARSPAASRSGSSSSPSDASQKIDARIAELGDWRGAMLARVRALIHEACPDIVETWKWRGVPVWEKDGIVCTGESYKAVVKLTFAHGAALPDPSGLFNASLDGNVRRAIDLKEGDVLEAAPFKALVRAAVAEIIAHTPLRRSSIISSNSLLSRR